MSLLQALAIRGKSPYTTALTHGWVINARGEKKSSPAEPIFLADTLREQPADLIRLYFLSTDIHADNALSIEEMQNVEPVYRSIRNTFRFLLGNLHDYLPREPPCTSTTSTL